MTMPSHQFDVAPFVLQDHKRLPARFFSGISGALICRSL
jgi:hypothetical protein